MSTREPSGPESSIPMALAAVFAGIAVLATTVAAAYRTPVPLAIAAPFGLSASLVWYHATGRLHRRLRRRAVAGGRAGSFRTGGVGAGRADGRSAGRADGRARRAGRGRADRGPTAGRRSEGAGAGARGPPPKDHAAPTRAEAYRALGLEPGADADAVRAAYRRKVKEVHPDRGGDEAAFREVTEAYDRLTDGRGEG